MVRIKRDAKNQAIADRVRQRLVALGKTARKASIEAGLGTSAVRHILDGNSISPRGDTLAALARVLQTSEAWLLHGEVDVARQRDAHPGAMRSMLEAVKMPVFVTTESQNIGELVIESDPIDWLPRPAILEYVQTAYAVIVAGESMSPAYKPGDRALINPKLVPLAGNDCIVLFGATPSYEQRAVMAEFVGATPEAWIVRQHDRSESIALSATDWRRVHRIVGKFNRD